VRRGGEWETGEVNQMKKLIAMASAALFFGGVAHAQNGVISSPTSIIPNFDVQSIGPVLNEIGVAWQAQKTAEGTTYIAANVGGQVNFILAPAACRGEAQSDCVGLSMVALFDGQANPQTVQAFNYRYAFASAGLDPSGAAYISRYEIADFGTPRGNLATSIKVFANQVVRLGAELDSARRTVSLDGYADDLSASFLNKQGAMVVSGEQAHELSAVEQHQEGFELAAQQVKSLIANKNAPRNKISNITK